MTLSNGNIFGVTGHSSGNSPVIGGFPWQRPVTRSFDVFFDQRLNKRLSKRSWGWWFETLTRPLWRHCNVKSYNTMPEDQSALRGFGVKYYVSNDKLHNMYYQRRPKKLWDIDLTWTHSSQSMFGSHVRAKHRLAVVSSKSDRYIFTHWGWDKMAASFQTTFWNEFSWMKINEVRFGFR